VPQSLVHPSPLWPIWQQHSHPLWPPQVIQSSPHHLASSYHAKILQTTQTLVCQWVSSPKAAWSGLMICCCIKPLL
jgi:hypothetical protein